MNLDNFLAPKKKLAQAYVPFQKINQIYSLSTGLYFGTIFPELNMPCKFDFYMKDKNFFHGPKNNFMEAD